MKCETWHEIYLPIYTNLMSQWAGDDIVFIMYIYIMQSVYYTSKLPIKRTSCTKRSHFSHTHTLFTYTKLARIHAFTHTQARSSLTRAHARAHKQARASHPDGEGGRSARAGRVHIGIHGYRVVATPFSSKRNCSTL